MSNKMPAVVAKKTKSALKSRSIKLVGAVLFLFIIVFVLIVADRMPPSTKQTAKPSSTCAITAPVARGVVSPRGYNVGSATTKCLDLEVADTSESRMKGLSNRAYLPRDRGLLFIFDNESEECFWMKDMNFSIDMIFMDSNKKVTKIYSNVSPDSYPDTFCADNTKYVLEVNAGLALQSKISEGQVINF